jgi:PKD repeat protein
MKKLFTVFVVLALLAIGSNSLFAIVKVGEEVHQRFETPHPYAGKKGVVWEQEFYYPDAGYIAIHFTKFDLAKGDILEISDPEGSRYYVYKEKGKKIKNRITNTETMISEFWATHIPGDTAIVRLISKNKRSDFGFVIDKWVRGFEEGYIQALMADDMEDGLSRIEAICNSDDKEWAKCYQGTAMYNESKAVCRLLLNGSSACTGWLLGSEGHVMTNEHCIGSQSTASNTDYEFMAEGATCSTNCGSWFACPGTVVADSGTLIQLDSALDYALVLLPTNVTGTYGYMQFRDTLPALDERIYIPQHPGAKGKMLAVESDTDGPYAKIYSTSQSPCSGGPGDIGYYADTEGGSSGSPVLGYSDNLVVALHHCANCPNRGVPIPSIISDLGGNIPNNAIGGGAPPDPPVANFTANTTTVSEGQSVNFTDTSSNNPTSWSWSFEGGSPSSSSSQDPSVTYNTAGTYDVSLTAYNSAGNDTETKYNYITVTEATPTVGNTTVFGSTSTSPNRRAMPFTMPQNGDITSVTMYHTGGSGSMILGVYDGSGTPQNRLGVTNTTTVSGSTGWQTINLTSSAYVASGSTVWLAWVYQSNPGIRYQTGSPGRYQSSSTWSGGMPDPFGSGSQSSYLYSIYASYSPAGGPSYGTVGNTSVFGSTSTSGYRRAMPFTMPENGTIQSVTMYHTGGSGSMILAVYDGSSTPQNRLAVTSTTSVSGSTGWQTINVTSPVYVSSGSPVWLAWVYESNPGIRYQTGSPGRYQSTQTWSGGMPNPFGSGSQSSYLYSIYATYEK